MAANQDSEAVTSLRTIPAATEYKLRSAHEMEEMLYSVTENYIDIGFFKCDAAPVESVVLYTAQVFSLRSPGERELAALGVL